MSFTDPETSLLEANLTMSGAGQSGDQHEEACQYLERMGVVLQTLREKKISLSILQAVTSLYLHREDRITLSTLAAMLKLTTAAVTNVADGLEGLDFAHRSLNRMDRRRTYIALTPRGLAFAEWFSAMMASGAAPDWPVVATSAEPPEPR